MKSAKSAKSASRKAFTLAELLVAVAIMAMALTAAGWIFKISLDATRAANATAEIMRNYRAITDQLNSDFAGFRQDGPIAVLRMHAYGSPNDLAYDSIWFCANGDFQTVRQYPDWKGDYKTISGNTAFITYAMSTLPPPYEFDDPCNPTKMRNFKKGPQKILIRRQTIFTSDSTMVPYPAGFGVKGFTGFPRGIWEYTGGTKGAGSTDISTYSQWLRLFDFIAPAYFELLPNVQWCWTNMNLTNLSSLNITRRYVLSNIDATDPNNYPMLMVKGIEDFQIEPLFKGSAPALKTYDPNGTLNWCDPFISGRVTSGEQTGKAVALKFSFTLYSKTLVNGRPLVKRFSHIVDLTKQD